MVVAYCEQLPYWLLHLTSAFSTVRSRVQYDTNTNAKSMIFSITDISMAKTSRSLFELDSTTALNAKQMLRLNSISAAKVSYSLSELNSTTMLNAN